MSGRETISIAASLVESAVKERGGGDGGSPEGFRMRTGGGDGRKESSRTSTGR